VVCEYLGLEETALAGFYRLADEKLAAAVRRAGTGRES
jgi:hypothetical protein